MHLTCGMPPLVRKDGSIQPLDASAAALTPDAMTALLDAIVPEKNRLEFQAKHDTDFAYEIPGLARFRANMFLDRKGPGAVFRVIPSQILTAEQLGLSPHILSLCRLHKGLVLVTGPTGSGKSTTLCAMVDYMNRTREDHLITIEDPIEFVHENKKCLINQREVHTHTDSFKHALRAALREDPDIVLVGEMRDLETVQIAIETAETGHLVFGTLHTASADTTIDRIVNAFPPHSRDQVRSMLADSLKAVLCQHLIPRRDGSGRVLAAEVLVNNDAVANLIRKAKAYQIPAVVATAREVGMQAMDTELRRLVAEGVIAPEEAYMRAASKKDFEQGPQAEPAPVPAPAPAGRPLAARGPRER